MKRLEKVAKKFFEDEVKTDYRMQCVLNNVLSWRSWGLTVEDALLVAIC